MTGTVVFMLCWMIHDDEEFMQSAYHRIQFRMSMSAVRDILGRRASYGPGEQRPADLPRFGTVASRLIDKEGYVWIGELQEICVLLGEDGRVTGKMCRGRAPSPPLARFQIRIRSCFELILEQSQRNKLRNLNQ
jgi:hypothetical protein